MTSANHGPFRWADLATMSTLAISAVLVVGVTLIASISGPNPWMQSALGLSAVPTAALPARVTIAIAAHTGAFDPPVTVTDMDGDITFISQSGAPVLVRSTGLDPAQFVLRIGPHGHAGVRLSRPGLYHYYDALSARPLHVVAGNEVIVDTRGSGPPRQGWIAVLATVPGLAQQVDVPPERDLFMPKALVAVVGSTITVANHDAGAHNLVMDPASPTGAAFVISGTDTEPPHGWHHFLVLRQPGLYHMYCTIHTRVVGTLDGWRVVAPRPNASGYTDHDPMELWVIVLPAYVSH